MTRFSLILHSMMRNPGRSALLGLSIAFAFFVYLVLASFEYGFQVHPDQSERLVVTNKTGNAQPLPIAYFNRLSDIPGIGQATYAARSRATYKDPTDYLGLVATQINSFAPFAGAQYEFGDDVLLRMAEKKDGAMVGRGIAEQEGWSVGQTITLKAFSFLKPDKSNEFTFEIVGIFDGKQPVDTYFVVVNYDYVNLARAVDKDTVSFFGIVPRDGARPEDVISAVDGTFANSAYETRTQTESQFMKAFFSQFADISTIVRLVAGVGFATILMIVTNTMYFAMRERTREVGVLKVIGFSRGFIFFSMLAETAMLFAVGLACAYVAALIAVMLMQQPLSSIVPSMRLAPVVALSAIAIASVFALVAGAIPAIGAMRIPPVAAMKE